MLKITITKEIEMAALDGLEKSLEGVFVKSAPKLPEDAKKALVQWLPWINLILGIFTAWAAYALWHWAHIANSFVDYANQISRAYGGNDVVSSRMTTTIWLGVILLAVEAVLYLMAFPETKKRIKRGWDLMFYALLLSIVYGVVTLFSDYNGGSVIGTLVGAVVGLWLLFQIRDRYLSKKV